MSRGAANALSTALPVVASAEGLTRRIRRRAIRRSIVHGMLLFVPFTYVFLTWLR